MAPEATKPSCNQGSTTCPPPNTNAPARYISAAIQPRLPVACGRKETSNRTAKATAKSAGFRDCKGTCSGSDAALLPNCTTEPTAPAMARANICIQVSPIIRRLTATSKAMAIRGRSGHRVRPICQTAWATTATTNSLRPCIQPPLPASGQALNPSAKLIMISADGRVNPSHAAKAPR